MLTFSELLTLCTRAIDESSLWQLDRHYPLMAWSYENGCWACICKNNKWTIAFWTYCNEKEANRIVETQDYMLYLTVMLRKQLRGDVMLLYLLIGNPDITDRKVLKDIMKMTDTKKILYHKTKTSRFYLQEVI